MRRLKFIEKIKGYSDERIFILDQKISYTYKELVKSVSNKLLRIENEIPSKSVVVIRGDYSIDAIAWMFALALKKNIFIPIIPTNEAEFLKKKKVSKPNFEIDLSSDTISPLQYLNNREQKYNTLRKLNRSGLVLFSSGSTGTPKAMIHDFDSLLSSYEKSIRLRTHRFMIFLLFDHIGGINTLLNIMSFGASMVIPRERDPEYIGMLIQKFGINILPTSPTFLNLMLIGNVYDNYDLSSLLLISYGTEPMPEALLKKIKSKLPKVKLIQTFGTSETGIIKTISRSSTSLDIKFDDKNQEFNIILYKAPSHVPPLQPNSL